MNVHSQLGIVKVLVTAAYIPTYILKHIDILFKYFLTVYI